MAAESKWLTVEQFRKVYDTAYALYGQETKPEKTYDNAKRHEFSMDFNRSAGLGSERGNASFEEYIEAKLKTYYSKE